MIQTKKRVKAYLIQRYDCYCMICRRKIKIQDIQLHHIEKFEICHCTTIENSSLVCDNCHKQINYAELYNIEEYNRLNNTIIEYKNNTQKRVG